MLWIQFFIAAGLIVFFGRKLSLFGDIISEKTPLSGSVIGFSLLAIITSFPELITSIGAVATLKIPAPDLALGNIFGSIMCNLFILVLIDAYFAGSLLKTIATKQNSIILILTILMSVIAMVFMFIKPGLILFNVGADSWLILAIYIISLKYLYSREDKKPDICKEIEKKYEHTSLGKVFFGFVFSAAVILCAGLWLSHIGDSIARETTMSHTFVGILFLAISTSLPELTVSFTAVRLGAIEMSVGNLLGSNIFNVLIIVFADIFFKKGDVLSASSTSTLVACFLGLLMNLVLLISLVHKTKPVYKKRISLTSIVLAIIYLTGMIFLYKIR
ncbi:MAG: hypothetical protein P9M03_04625 [Candidatus Theseobacter exili]|nr:hypothetical protein [Candidatus Theseobacter exili]